MKERKVYVTLGFHTSFYHSWRGDSPDEAGFGTDIRVVREILHILSQANAEGKQARGYWDFDVYFTVENILPQFAPDILEGIRARVESGHDEIVLGPYNNGTNHAATERELQQAIAYAIENPFGSGLRQVFPATSNLYRPQEAMVTTGQNAFFQEAGIDGLILYYGGVPFNTLSTFIPRLTDQQRYNPLWMRTQPDESPLVLLPCMSISDLLEFVCFEALLLDLHRKQLNGEIHSDVLVHLNADADLEAWLPVDLPRAIRWFPNLGGLQEYIEVVNRYPWAEFSVPSEYLAAHPPQGEVFVRQDLADGGFDGSYPWAEKYTSLLNWTLVERSRLETYRAMAITPEPEKPGTDKRLWEGIGSPFFQRLIGLSTTHFGMSTPVINEERQAKASEILGRAYQGAMDVHRSIAQGLQALLPEDSELLYAFEVSNIPRSDSGKPAGCWNMVRIPVAVPEGIKLESLIVDNGPEAGQANDQNIEAGTPFSWINPVELGKGWTAGELVFPLRLDGEERRRFSLTTRIGNTDGPKSEEIKHALKNRWLEIAFSSEHGIERFTYQGSGQEPLLTGDSNLLQPFITYGRGAQATTYRPSAYRIVPLDGERWDGLARTRLETHIDIPIDGRPYRSTLVYTFSLFNELPYLFVDVKARYAATPTHDVIHSYVQKLHRPLDLDWQETAPFQLQPIMADQPGKPLRVWKHNHLGVTSSFDLDYGEINQRNQEWDSMNHQVTAGWVAVSDQKSGILLVQSCYQLVSMAFCPMRLRVEDSRQVIELNPFGSYFGKLPDYSHLGGNGIGAEFTKALSGALKPNAPSFNGRNLQFSLMLAPYWGDEPAGAIQADAAAFFYPPGVLIHHSPLAQNPILPEDLSAWIDNAKKERLVSLFIQDETCPIPAPVEFLANPGDRQVTLVWRQPPGASPGSGTSPDSDLPVTAFQVRWKMEGESEWGLQTIAPDDRWTLTGLENGSHYAFQVRAEIRGRTSAWTEPAVCTPGAVAEVGLTSNLAAIPGRTFLKLIWLSLVFEIRKRFRRSS